MAGQPCVPPVQVTAMRPLSGGAGSGGSWQDRWHMGRSPAMRRARCYGDVLVQESCQDAGLNTVWRLVQQLPVPERSVRDVDVPAGKAGGWVAGGTAKRMPSAGFGGRCTAELFHCVLCRWFLRAAGPLCGSVKCGVCRGSGGRGRQPRSKALGTGAVCGVLGRCPAPRVPASQLRAFSVPVPYPVCPSSSCGHRQPLPAVLVC